MATPPDFIAGQVLTAAQLNKIGLWVVKNETAFSAASSVTADGIFTSDFTNYRMVLRYTTSTTNLVSVKLRVGGVSASTNYNHQRFGAGATSTFAARDTAQTSQLIGFASNGAFFCATTTDLIGPQLAEPTSFISATVQSDGAYTTPVVGNLVGNHSTATAYDGIEILVASGTFTGSYTIYGYNK